MKKILWLLVLFIIVNCIQGHNVFARNNENYFKGKVKTIHSKYKFNNSYPIKLNDGRIFFYDGLNILLFDPKTDTIKKSQTIPVLDTKYSKFSKVATKLPDGNILIIRPQNFPTRKLELDIIKTLKLTFVKDNIFPYIKAYPDLYKEYLRQEKISENSNYAYIYNPETEKIIMSKNKHFGIPNYSVVGSNGKIYMFKRVTQKEKDIIKKQILVTYDPISFEFEPVDIDIKNTNDSNYALKNVIALNNNYIILLFGGSDIYNWDPPGYYYYYLFDVNTNKLSEPKYLKDTYVDFFIKNRKIVIKPENCKIYMFYRYNLWDDIPDKFLKYIDKESIPLDREIVENYIPVYPKCTDENWRYNSVLLDDGRILFPDKGKVKILTLNKNKQN